MAFDSKSDPISRRLGLIVLAVAAPALVVFVVLEIRFNHGRDIAPDILAQLFPIDRIYQGGASHYVLFAEQCDGQVCLTVLIQNLREGPGTFYLKVYTPHYQNCPLEVPILRLAIVGSSVMRATAQVPLPGIVAPVTIELKYSGSAQTKGRRVRFAVRQAVANSTIAALGSVFAHVDLTRVRNNATIFLSLDPIHGDAPPPANQWVADALWTPAGPKTAEEIHALLGFSVA